MGYLGQTIKGLSWIATLRGVTRGMSFVRILVLARLLSPSQFGLFGIASFVLALVEVVTETGINIFLVQKEGKIDSYINSAWAVSILRGIVIFIVIIVSAPIISWFFKAPGAYILLVQIAMVPLVRGFINPSIVKFQKELEFSKEFLFRSSVISFEAAVSILFVYFTKSPEGLIWGLIVSALFEVIISFLFVEPRPRLKFEKIKFFEVIHTGKWVTMSSIFTYLYQNVDDMAVVKILNTTSLGLYQMAYKISMLPITEVADVIARVTFPVYAKISGDKVRLRKAFVKTSFTTFVICMPAVGIFVLFPYEIVSLLLGPEWLGTVNALRILAFFGLFRALTSPALILLLSLKRQDLVAKLSLATFMLLALTIVPFVHNWGIEGAAVSSVLASVLVLPLAYFSAISSLNKSS